MRLLFVRNGRWGRLDRRKGHGICIYENKDRYYGRWMNDYCHGYGILITANGTKYKGLMKLFWNIKIIIKLFFFEESKLLLLCSFKCWITIIIIILLLLL